MNKRRILLMVLALVAAAFITPAARAQPGSHAAPPGTVEKAEAEHGEHDKAGVLPTAAQGIVPAIVSLVVFGLVFAVLAVKVWPTITKGLDDRANKIREEIAAAEAARKQAKDALEQYERSLADARAEAQKMLERTKAQQQALAEELKAKADAELNAMRERAKRDIDSAKRAALSEIYNQSATIATAIAAKILQREVNARDQERLVAESLNELTAAQR